MTSTTKTDISPAMRDALIQITARNSDGSDIAGQTLDALERRGLVAPFTADVKVPWDATKDGREILGLEFRARREALPGPDGKTGQTRDELAALLGVTDTAIYLWESGRRPIQPMTWRALEWAEIRAVIRYRLPKAMAGILDETAEFITASEAAAHAAKRLHTLLAVEPALLEGEATDA